MKHVMSLFVALLIPGLSHAAPWNLPKDLTTSNAKVTFEVDTTWHMVHGTVKEVRGGLALHEASDFHGVKGSIVVPVIGLDTDNGSRDETLRESMHSDKFPEIRYDFDKIEQICAPESLSPGSACPFTINGKLTIRDVTRDVPLSGNVTFNGANYVVKGETTIKWLDYGIEDPSMFVASVYEDAKIGIEVTL